MTFEQWWEATYAGQLGLLPLELAFKEMCFPHQSAADKQEGGR